MKNWKETIHDKNGLLFVSIREAEAFIAQTLKDEREAICEGYLVWLEENEDRYHDLEDAFKSMQDYINLIKQRNEER